MKNTEMGSDMSDVSIMYANKDIFSRTPEDLARDEEVYNKMYPEEDIAEVQTGFAYSVLHILQNIHNARHNFMQSEIVR